MRKSYGFRQVGIVIKVLDLYNFFPIDNFLLNDW